MLTIERKIQLAFLVALILSGVIGVMSYASLSRLRGDVAWVVHTQQVIATLESLFSSVTDAVAAQRGYVLSGREVFLEAHSQALRGMDADLRALRALTRDNAEQQGSLDRLARLTAERAKFSNGVIELRRRGDVAGAQAMVARGRGNEIHAEIRAFVDRMQESERLLLQQREAQAEQSSRKARLVVVLGGLLGLAVVAGALYLVARDFSGRRRADAELANAMATLEGRVVSRTADLEAANRSLHAGEVRLHGIVQSAMDAIITVDERQRIVLFNAAAEAIFRCPATEALDGTLDRFIPARFREAHRGHVAHFGTTGATTRAMGGRRELFGLRADGEEFPLDASISHVLIDGERYYTVILRDVTERLAADVALERSRRELREAGERLLAVIHSAMDAIITVDDEQRIVLFNEAAEKIFRCKTEEAVGQPLDRFIPERFRAAHRSHVERFGHTRVTTRVMGARLSLSGLRADGEEFPIDASISQATIEGRKLYTVILRDITERKRAEEALERSYRELRELSAVMHDVREAERLRIARELHDELAQWLTAIKMDVAWLAARLPKDQEALLDKTAKMRSIVDTTVSAVRRIAADLRPVMLDDLGLPAALESLLHDLSQRADIVVSLEADEAMSRIGEPLASALYRIAQEALTNVARHAGATEVRVSLCGDDERVVLSIRDNGRGFDPEAQREKKSYGILGIRERAATLGGEARVAPLAEGGTQVEVTVPMARYRRQERIDGESTAG